MALPPVAEQTEARLKRGNQPASKRPVYIPMRTPSEHRLVSSCVWLFNKQTRILSLSLFPPGFLLFFWSEGASE